MEYTDILITDIRILPPSSEGIGEALTLLRSGGLVIHATETCYGIACDLTNPQAVAQLFMLKHRPLDQPVSALFASIEEAKKYVEWNAKAEELAKKYLPGALTMILPFKPSPPYPLSLQGEGEKGGEGQKTLAIRISSHPVAQKLAEKFGKPLSTTSANVHGRPNTYSVEEILQQFSSPSVGAYGLPREASAKWGHTPLPQSQSILILDSGPLPKTPPSTIIDLTTMNSGLVREGDIALE